MGAVIGSKGFKSQYVKDKVAGWVKELQKLTEIARSEPHAAYSAFTFGFKSKFNYLMRTVSGISELLAPLDEAVDNFIRSIFQGREFSSVERKLFSLPVKLGGLGVDIPSEICQIQYENSRLVTSQLIEQIKLQSSDNIVDTRVLDAARRKVV